MGYKVAIASSDGNMIDEHFGKAGQFYIFELVGDHFDLVENRIVPAPSSVIAHNPDEIVNRVDLLSDCKMVLAGGIGPLPAKLLRSKGIICLTILGSVYPTLDIIVTSYDVKNYLKTPKNEDIK